jgi:hypothetical protein
MNTRAYGISMDSYLSMLGSGALFSILGLLIYILFEVTFCMHAWQTCVPSLPLFPTMPWWHCIMWLPYYPF